MSAAAAAAGRGEEKVVDIPEDYICPITSEIMEDPVFTADGHTYERVAISRWLESRNTSPLTNARLATRTLTPNIVLKKLIREFKEKRPAMQRDLQVRCNNLEARLAEMERLNADILKEHDAAQTHFTSNDLLAVITEDGLQEWYKNDQVHRDNDLPALIAKDGQQEWYKNGQLHRDNDLPALIGKDGPQEWYKNGQVVRKQDCVIN